MLANTLIQFNVWSVLKQHLHVLIIIIFGKINLYHAIFSSWWCNRTLWDRTFYGMRGKHKLEVCANSAILKIPCSLRTGAWGGGVPQIVACVRIYLYVVHSGLTGLQLWLDTKATTSIKLLHLERRLHWVSIPDSAITKKDKAPWDNQSVSIDGTIWSDLLTRSEEERKIQPATKLIKQIDVSPEGH